MRVLTFPTYDTVDLFAGPGGWSVAARDLELREIGLESDKAAHQTRRAAGFHTIRDDVRKWSPANFPNARGLIASPPCQTFSAAGKGAGRRALDVVLDAIKGMALEHVTRGAYSRAAETYVQPTWEDERTGLVLEPLRWALDAIRLGQPYDWLAFEQVPTVLPVWEAMAGVLRSEGYSVAVGNLQAEQYGVPQTRKRAVLIARHVGSYDVIEAGSAQDVSLPDPTHSRYHTRDKARLDSGVLPWVSMAQALGWDRPVVSAQSVAGVSRAVRDAENPSFTVTETTSRVMRSNYGTGGDPTARGERAQDEPAPTVTGKIDRNKWLRSSTMPNSAVRHADEPAATVAFGHDRNSRTAQDTAGQIPRAEDEPAHTVTGKGTAAWIGDPCRCDMLGAVAGRPGPAHRSDASGQCEWFSERAAVRFGNQEHSAVRGADEPAATLRYGERMNATDWVHGRPATTVAGDARIGQPGHKCMTESCCGTAGVTRQFAEGSVRVSVQEAAVLQSFPVDFPWQGSRTKQYQQIGNAIPPLLAEAVLRQVVNARSSD